MVVIIRTFIKDYKNILEYIVSWMTGTMDIIFEFPCTVSVFRVILVRIFPHLYVTLSVTIQKENENSSDI